MWPDRMLMKLRYVDTTNTAISTPASLVPFNVGYRLNSPFSPRTAVVTADIPPGYNEMITLYQNYRVHAVKVTVDIENLSTALPLTAIYTMAPSLPNGGITTYGEMLEVIGNPYVVWGTSGIASGQCHIHLESYVKLEKLVGQRTVSTDNDYAALFNAIPVKVLLGNLYIKNPGTTAASVTCGLIVQIEFFCEFYGRITDVN